MGITETSEEGAMRQMDEVRSKFPGQQPLIQVVDDKPQLIERAGTGAEGGGSITAFYTVLAEGDDENDPIVDATPRARTGKRVRVSERRTPVLLVRGAAQLDEDERRRRRWDRPGTVLLLPRGQHGVLGRPEPG